VNRRPFARGFTLIEMVITVAIVGLLASAAMPVAELAYRRSRELDLRLALREIRGGLDAYKRAVDQGRIALEVGQSGYPPTLVALVDGVEDARDPEGRRIYFLRRIPRDPLFPDSNTRAEATWGLRSYASTADAPVPGEDVFDVHSLSGASGIDGVPYRDW
jgi:general secretion pathway protein G